MKKKRIMWHILDESHKKNWMIMRLCVMFVFFFLFIVFANSVAQDQVISLNLKNVSFYQLFDEIHRQTGLRFIYNTNQLEKMDKLDIHAEKKKVKDVLRDALAETPFTFLFDKDVVMLVQKEEKEKKSIRLKGFVYDTKKQPMPGVTVKLIGTSVGTATDANGWFSVVLPVKKGQLEFSFIGFRSQIVYFLEKTETDTLKITLHEDMQAIDEVVVTGYGDVSRKNYTGAATTVRAADILMPGVSSIDQMLQGVVPGMLVWNTTGQVGATPKIRVRGTSTLLGSQEPVWVVDGVIQRDIQPFNSEDNTKFSTDADDIKQLAGNAISYLFTTWIGALEIKC